jgi:hypothetical protein
MRINPIGLIRLVSYPVYQFLLDNWVTNLIGQLVNWRIDILYKEGLNGYKNIIRLNR